MNKITEPLMEWYQKQKLNLPWRDKHNPYYTWISEIMLQQTRVEAVKPYFQRFVSALPGIEQLAECSEEQLLKTLGRTWILQSCPQYAESCKGGCKSLSGRTSG